MKTTRVQLFWFRALKVAVCLIGVWCFCANRAPAVSAPILAADGGGEDELAHLLKARYETASNLLLVEEKRLHENVTTLGRVCEVARWVRDSAVELPMAAQERLTALTNYVALARRLEESVQRAARSGAATAADCESARYLRLDAEVTLLRAKLHPQ
jgi:hypothetical protein